MPQHLPLTFSLVLLALGPATAAAQPTSPDTQATSARARELGDAFGEVAGRVSAAVVALRVEARASARDLGLPFPFGGMQRDGETPLVRGMGSGVIVRADGYILTNHHVVENAERIEVAISDGRRFSGTVVGRDPATDLALVRVQANGLPTLRFARPADVRVGEWAIAVGAPFGLEHTVTVGVVSALSRGGLGAAEIEDYVQTDASINPGNSGGPLVDLDGNVIGINTMIAGSGTGIGFAVPAEIAQLVAEQLMTNGRVVRAYIGVTFQPLTPELARELGVPAEPPRGALVADVAENAPAARAGMRAGDVVVSVDGDVVDQGHDLQRHVLRRRVGDRVRLELIRDRRRASLTVRTGERPSAGGDVRPSPVPRDANGGNGRGHGLTLERLTPELRDRIGTRASSGVVVTAVSPGSPADRAGLRPGDLIVEADRRPAGDPRDVERAADDGTALVRVLRRDGALYTVIGNGD